MVHHDQTATSGCKPTGGSPAQDEKVAAVIARRARGRMERLMRDIRNGEASRTSLVYNISCAVQILAGVQLEEAMEACRKEEHAEAGRLPRHPYLLDAAKLFELHSVQASLTVDEVSQLQTVVTASEKTPPTPPLMRGNKDDVPSLRFLLE